MKKPEDFAADLERLWNFQPSHTGPLWVSQPRQCVCEKPAFVQAVEDRMARLANSELLPGFGKLSDGWPEDPPVRHFAFISEDGLRRIRGLLQ